MTTPTLEKCGYIELISLSCTHYSTIDAYSRLELGRTQKVWGGHLGSWGGHIEDTLLLLC